MMNHVNGVDPIELFRAKIQFLGPTFEDLNRQVACLQLNVLVFSGEHPRERSDSGICQCV